MSQKKKASREEYLPVVVPDTTFRKAQQLVLANGQEWSLLEMKTYDFLLSKISSAPDEQYSFDIPDNQFFSIYSSTGRSHISADKLREVCDKISSTKFTYLDPDTGEWSIMNLLPYCSFSPLERKFKMEITPTLARLVRNPTVFAPISLVHHSKYDTKSAYKLYQVFSLMIMRNRETTYSCEDFIKLLDLSESTTFRVHLHRTIKPIVEQINNNKHGFIAKFRLESLRQGTGPGRKPTTHITLILELDKQNINELAIENDEEISLALSELQINEANIKVLTATYPKEILLNCYKQTMLDVANRKDKDNPIKSPSSWFYSMIKNKEWQKNMLSSLPEKPAKSAPRAAHQQYESQVSHMRQRQNAFMQYLALDIERQREFLNEFAIHLSVSVRSDKETNANLINIFYKDGLNDPEINSIFTTWLIGWKGFSPKELELD